MHLSTLLLLLVGQMLLHPPQEVEEAGAAEEEGAVQVQAEARGKKQPLLPLALCQALWASP